MKNTILSIGLLLLAGTAGAKQVYVNAETGNDSNDGLSDATAVATITTGATLIAGGDELIVRPGVYYERPVFWNLGSGADSVWVRAEPRGHATISGAWEEAATGTAQWAPVPGHPGVWEAPHGEAVFGNWEGFFLFRFNTLEGLSSHTAVSVDKWWIQPWIMDLPEYGFACENGMIYLRLPWDIDPNGESVFLSTGGDSDSSYEGSIVNVYRSPQVIFDGFGFEGSGTQCLRFDLESPGAVVRNSTFSYCGTGVRLPDYSRIEWTEYSYPGLTQYAEAVLERNPQYERFDVIYDLVKEYLVVDGQHVVMLEGAIAGPAASWTNKRASVGCEFHHNFMHDAFDGERLGNFDDSESHHNVYWHNFDDHLEFEGWPTFEGKNLVAHHSLFLGSARSMISHQDSNSPPSMTGPQLVYRNVLYYDDPVGESAWTMIKSDLPAAVEGVHYIHNTIWGKRDMHLYWNAENLRLANNLIIFEDSWDGASTPLPDFSDGNILIDSQSQSYLLGEHDQYLGPWTSGDPFEVAEALQLTDLNAFNFTPLHSSVLVDAGIVIEGINDDLPTPPDVGAFEAGDNPYGYWPRPTDLAFNCSVPTDWTGPIPEFEPSEACWKGPVCAGDNITAGADDPAIEACVCALDDYCCNTQWDGVCVQVAEASCGADCDFSEPGEPDPAGPCADPMDQDVLGLPDLGIITRQCSLEHPGDATGAVGCVHDVTGVSDSCGGCFHERYACAAVSCACECAEGIDSDPCNACMESSCDPDFLACTGT